jgi:hypothetical protein
VNRPPVLSSTPPCANTPHLLELYAHNFTEFHSLDIGADGKFGYKSLPLYWSEPSRHPFFVRVDGKLAGLALVKRGSEITGIDCDIAIEAEVVGAANLAYTANPEH